MLNIKHSAKSSTKNIIHSIYKIEEIMNGRTEEDSVSLQMELLAFVTLFGEYCTIDLLGSLCQKALEMGCSSEEIKIAFSDAQTSKKTPILDQSFCSIVGIGENIFSISILEETYNVSN